MIGKRSLNLILLISIVSLFSILTFISAQPYGGYGSGFGFIDLGEGIRQIIDQATRFLAPLFEVILGDYSGSEFFFTKILVLALLFVVIYWILERVPALRGYRNIAMLISLIVSILAVRFISENELVNGILLPYGVLGVALTTLIPFMIFAYGIHTTDLSGAGRKIAWAVFALIFFILWVYKYPELNPIANQIYLWALVAVIIVMIFDKSIHAYFAGADMKKFSKNLTTRQIADLQVELGRLRNSPVMSNEIERRIQQIERDMRHLRAREASY